MMPHEWILTDKIFKTDHLEQFIATSFSMAARILSGIRRFRRGV